MTTIIRDNTTLRESFGSLQRGDIVLGRVSLRTSEENLLVDLLSRGVRLVPSALSQLLSRSKVLQAEIFGAWLPPRTFAIHDTHQLLAVLGAFTPDEKVVTKQDRKNAGLGIHLWASVEEVYSHATLGNLAYPFVLQAFQPKAKDIRVVWLGDYIEAYWRENSANFRNNLHCGGKSTPCELTDKQLSICREVMARGAFPYAHIDLMVSEDADFLMEINLRGGIKGARIKAGEYAKRVDLIHSALLGELQSL